MARLTYGRPESSIYESITTNIHDKLGSTYDGVDSTINIISESVSNEIINLRRENERFFESNQLSNATGAELDSLAFETYRLTRRPPSFSKTSYRHSNLHFYVEQGTFGEINGGVSITIPEGTLVSTKNTFEDNTIIYEIADTYELGVDENYVYCSAVALNPGAYANVSSNSLNYHDFTNYSDVLNDTLKVTNKYAVINGENEESDTAFRYRAANHIQSLVNSNRDAAFLKTLGVPGINEVRIIPSYFGIGTTAVVAFGQGRELTQDVASLIEERLLELEMPGQNVQVINGITVFLDFKIKTYIKTGLSEIEKQNIISEIKRDIANLIKLKEFNNFLDFTEISNIVRRRFTSDKIIGFGSSQNNSFIFEEVYARKTDRFSLFPEEKEAVLNSTYRLGREERVSFGEIIVELEEDIR
jgi:uncharacterized phage protein gp47/JayE